jgi:hypothetical protein
MAQLGKDLASLLIRLRRWLGEPDVNKSFWDSDNILKQILNSEYRMRCTELFMASEGYFVEVVQRDLTADQTRYAWPPNCERVLKLELVRTDGRRVPIVRFERHESIVSAPSSGGDTYSPTWRPIGGGYELEPGPNETVTNGQRMEFNSVPAELEADDDTLHSDWPDNFTEILVIDAALAAINMEAIQDDGQGMIRTLEYQRTRWEQRWERYIDSKIANSRNRIEPMIIYRDS